MISKKIGIFGGSFDPIHFGHLNLAISILETHHLDEIWFCPAYINPLKLTMQPAPAGDRLNMLKLALEGEASFKILDYEIMREGPSYTFDTLSAILSEAHQGQQPIQFFLILGEDSLKSFPNWHKAPEIVKLVPLLVGRRVNDPSLLPIKASNEILEAIEKGMTPTKFFEISSTEIRERLAQHRYCHHLVPLKVLDYILSHGLYSTSCIN